VILLNFEKTSRDHLYRRNPQLPESVQNYFFPSNSNSPWHLRSKFGNYTSTAVRQMALGVSIIIKILSRCFRSAYRISGRSCSSRVIFGFYFRNYRCGGRRKTLSSATAHTYTHTPLATEHVFPTIIISFALMTRAPHTDGRESAK